MVTNKKQLDLFDQKTLTDIQNYTILAKIENKPPF